MKRLILPVLMILLVAAAASCGKVPQGSQTPSTQPQEVDMTASNFATSAITWRENQPLKFVNPATGALHQLCFGHDQVCKPNPDGPAELNASSGVMFSPGDTKTYTFTKPGTYEVTCIIHPSMNVIITIQ
jgi:plastocyanin